MNPVSREDRKVKWLTVAAAMDIVIEVRPSPPRLGERLEIEVNVMPKRELQVSLVLLTLTCKEYAVKGGGKNRVAYYEPIHESTKVLAEQGSLSPGITQQWREWYEIPHDAMHTFECPDNEISWVTELRMAGSFPDIHLTHPVKVAPVRLKECRDGR